MIPRSPAQIHTLGNGQLIITFTIDQLTYIRQISQVLINNIFQRKTVNIFLLIIYNICFGY